MGKSKPDDTKTITFRIPSSLYKRIERFQSTLESGFQPTVSDALRILIERGLTASETP